MAYVELRRTLIPNNTGIGAPYTAVTDWYDPARRTVFSTEEDSQVSDPRALPTDQEIDRFEVRAGLVHIVRYDGHGSIYTTSLKSSGGGGPSTNLQALTTYATPYASGPGLADACVDATGHLGAPPYQLALTYVSGAGPGVGFAQTGVSPSEYYPWRFYNLAAGRYELAVTDASGARALTTVLVTDNRVVNGRGWVLQDTYSGDPQTGSGYQLFWVYNDHEVKSATYSGGGGGGGDYSTAYGVQIDSYFLPGGVSWRKVFSDGQGGVYFVDAPLDKAAAGSLDLHNLIWLHPDTAAERNGGILVEVNATALPVTFTLPGHAPNRVGSFDGLGPGTYAVTATDALGNTLTVTVELKLGYGKWRELTYQEVGSSTLFRLELWLKAYAGAASPIVGGKSPVVLASDGLNSSLGGQGDLPPVVGTSAELSFFVEPGTFDAIDAGPEFSCRVDFYRAGQLAFRGYVKPAGLSESVLLDGRHEATLTATDGLAGLKDVHFTGHQGQRLLGHRPWLNTIIHCLSRCNIALPLRFFTNRRDATMASTDAPETEATSNRTGYWKQGQDSDPLPQRDTLNALCQALGGTLVQRAGAWEIRSPLEAAADTPGRTYQPAGTRTGAATALAPAGAIRPPRAGGWCWLSKSQRKQVRAAWKSLTGHTDVGYLKNAFVPGTVFSDPYAWVTDASKLRALTGWKPRAGGSFPLVFVRTGDKQDKHATRWLRSATPAAADDNYVQSPLLPLAAGGEAVPAFLSFTGRVVASEQFTDPTTGTAYASPSTAIKALLRYEIVVDGQGRGAQLVELAAGSSDVTVTVPVDALPAGALGAVLRVGTWYAPLPDAMLLVKDFAFGTGYKRGEPVKYQGKFFVARQDMAALGGGIGIAPGSAATAPYWAEIAATSFATGQLLLSEIAVQLRPQSVTWDGDDNFRADGPAGTVRPTEVLEVFHADVPRAAGLYSGCVPAFGKAVALLDGTMSSSWRRPSDLQPAPLFESAVLDGLALRGGPSKLLLGTVSTAGLAPPYMLDAVDTPADVPGRRFLVAAWRWDTKLARVELSQFEIGAGEGLVVDIPSGARVTTNVVQVLPGQYLPELRVTEDGAVRVVEG